MSSTESRAITVLHGIARDPIDEIVASINEWGPAPKGVRVSVVIPTWNRGRYLGDSIEAIFHQQYPASGIEVIVADDGSTDDTPSVLDRVAGHTPCHLVYIKLKGHRGVSVARNSAVAQASGDIIAFTDSDCVADPQWLARGMAAFKSERIGIVHGNVYPCPGQRQPFFNHFIVMDRDDGSFSTCNIFYRKQAFLDAGGFDARRDYWEDVDLGWRTTRLGWESAYDPRVITYHQVVQVSPWRWLTWPLKSYNWPAKAARYPEFRRHLFARLWIDSSHALYTLLALGILFAVIFHPLWLVLALPYVVAFPRRHGLKGKWPPVKALLHFAWDTVGFVAALAGSIRFRSPVL